MSARGRAVAVFFPLLAILACTSQHGIDTKPDVPQDAGAAASATGTATASASGTGQNSGSTTETWTVTGGTATTTGTETLASGTGTTLGTGDTVVATGTATATGTDSRIVGTGTGRSSDAGTGTGTGVLYGITPGTWCYKITGVSAINDGCELSVGTLVGVSLPDNYDAVTGVFALGDLGSLGAGGIRYNVGTLVRVKGKATDATVPGCSWNQADTTTLTMVANNEFTASIVETQDTITAACGFHSVACMSSWTWNFAIDGTQNAATGCR